MKTTLLSLTLIFALNAIAASPAKPLAKAGHREFNTHVKLNYQSGQKLPLTLKRNGKRIQFEWPLQ